MSDYATMMEEALAAMVKEGRAPVKEVRKGPTEDRVEDEKPKEKES